MWSPLFWDIILDDWEIFNEFIILSIINDNITIFALEINTIWMKEAP